MPFKLARHFAERAAERLPSAPILTSPLADRQRSSIALEDLAGGIAFSEIPGFARAPMPAAAAPNDASSEQLKIQQDTYALMSGAGINVIVKNLDQQSRFG
ncbi:MAG TPA: hypothetical protein VKB78_11110 [Pirellulales bacterium]|nr:hypothetical protein [Pirellulales bacterium]